VAKKFGVSEQSVYRWGTSNDWVKRRADLGKKATEEFFKDREKLMVETNKKQFDELSEIEGGVLTAIKMLTENQNLILHDETLDSDQKYKLMKQLRMQALDLKSLAEALRIAQNQKRIILGMPTEISKADITQTNKNVTLSPEKAKAMTEFIKKNSIPKTPEPKQEETNNDGHPGTN
jgi:hypothetical protein